MDKNSGIFNSVEKILTSVKARLIAHTGLTSSQCHNIMPEEENSERILCDEDKEQMEKYKRKLELDLLTN